MEEGKTTTFVVGQKVVYLDPHPDAVALYIKAAGRRGVYIVAPIKDHVYTVREVLIVRDSPVIRLKEIVNPKEKYADGLTEVVFRASSFAPVQTIDTTNQVNALKKIVNDIFIKGKVNA